jgi:hypothetical protein
MDLSLAEVEGEGMFFAAYCSDAGADVLLGPDNVVDLRYGAFGPELHYRCHCGQPGVVYPRLHRNARPQPSLGPDGLLN